MRPIPYLWGMARITIIETGLVPQEYRERHGSFPEFAARTGGGLLFEPGDADALADALLSLARDPARAVELGQQGAAGVRREYSAARMAERTLEVYRSVCAAAARPGKIA